MLPSTQFANDAQPQARHSVLSAASLASSQQRENVIIGSSPTLLTALEQARRAARSDADILLQAESGTGKELLARLIHRESARALGPFVALNCAAVPETLLESELFGHVRGAFTGAQRNQSGKFALAHRGTLLLDEIGEMPLTLQPKLLRVLQEREFYRLGDGHPVTVDVRVIASTNRPLHLLLLQERFRQDLYFRLNVIPLSLPPLRERGEDVIELADYFVSKFAAPAPAPVISAACRNALRAYDWPGNVRELANCMRRAVALCEGTQIEAETLVFSHNVACSGMTPGLKPGLSLREMEKVLLQITLHATAGNRTHAAEMLGISLRTIRNKIREHGLPPRRSL